MRDDQRPDPGFGSDPPGLEGGEMVRVRLLVPLTGDGGLAQEDVGVVGEIEKIGSGPGIPRVHDGSSGCIEAGNECWHGMNRFTETDRYIVDLHGRTGVNLHEIEHRVENMLLGGPRECREVFRSSRRDEHGDGNRAGRSEGEIAVEAEDVGAVIRVRVAQHDAFERPRIDVLRELHERARAGIDPERHPLGFEQVTRGRVGAGRRATR